MPFCHLLFEGGYESVELEPDVDYDRHISFGPDKKTVIALQLGDHSHSSLSTSPLQPSMSSSSSSCSSGIQPKRARLDVGGHYPNPNQKLCVTVRYTGAPTADEDHKIRMELQESHQKTLRELNIALARAEQALKKITGEDIDKQELLSGFLEVHTITAEIKRRRALPSLEYQRQIINYVYVVYAGEPGKLLGVPGDPTLILHACCDSVQEITGARKVEMESVDVPVRNPILGKLSHEIKVGDRPQCIAILGKHVYVTTRVNIMVFNVEDYKCRTSWRYNGPRPTISNYGIAVTEDSVYVSRRDLSCVDVWTNPMNGSIIPAYQRSIGLGELLRPMGIAIFAGRLYVADTGHHRVVVFGLHGDFLFSWGPRDDDEYIRDLAIHDERVFVIDSDMNRVQVFDLDGDLQNMWGTGLLSAPTAITMYGDDVYILDQCGVQVITIDGQLIRLIEELSTPDYLFKTLAVSDAGQLWLSYGDTLRVFE